MRLHKDVKTAILRAIENDPEISRDDVVSYIKLYAGVPDVPKLIQREYNATARHLLASSRDEAGVRNIFATDDKAGTFVNLPKSHDLDAIRKATKQLQKKRDGINASLAKAKRRGAVVAGQTGMFDELEFFREVSGAN